MSEDKKDSQIKRPGGMHGGPAGSLGRPVEKAKNFKATLKRLLGYLKPQTMSLVIVIIFAIVATVFTVWGPKITGNAMNQLTDGFIAKSIVNGIDSAQPKMKSGIKAYTDAQANAVKAADTAVEQGMSKAVAAQKQQAYATAQAQAEAMAKAAVNKQFAAMAPGVPSSGYGSIPGYNDAIKTACALADTKAKAGVDAAFAKQQATIDTQLATAKTKAEATAKSAVDSAFLKNMKLTSAQFDIFKKLAALPQIKSTSDYNTRADIAKTFFDDMQSLPKSMISSSSSVSSSLKISNISNSDLTKYIGDIRETGGNIPFNVVGQTLLFLLGIYVLSSVFTFIMQYIMSTVAQTVVYDMRKNVNNKINRLPLKYFDSHTNGEILSRMTNDIDTISTTLQQSLTQLITSVFQILGYIIMMLTISPILTLIVMLTLPLYISHHYAYS